MFSEIVRGERWRFYCVFSKLVRVYVVGKAFTEICNLFLLFSNSDGQSFRNLFYPMLWSRLNRAFYDGKNKHSRGRKNIHAAEKNIHAVEKTFARGCLKLKRRMYC